MGKRGEKVCVREIERVRGEKGGERVYMCEKEKRKRAECKKECVRVRRGER